MVKPLGDIAEAIEVIVPLLGIAANQEGVFLRIYSETVLRSIAPLEGAVRLCSGKGHHTAPVLQQPVFLGAQSVDDLIQLCFELIGFQVLPMILPCCPKLGAASAEVASEPPDTFSLAHKLRTLSIGVLPLLKAHRSDFKLHFSPPLFQLLSCFSESPSRKPCRFHHQGAL